MMMRGTFANIHLWNKLLGEVGPKTIHIPSGGKLSVFDAAMVCLLDLLFFFPWINPTRYTKLLASFNEHCQNGKANNIPLREILVDGEIK